MATYQHISCSVRLGTKCVALNGNIQETKRESDMAPICIFPYLAIYWASLQSHTHTHTMQVVRNSLPRPCRRRRRRLYIAFIHGYRPAKNVMRNAEEHEHRESLKIFLLPELIPLHSLGNCKHLSPSFGSMSRDQDRTDRDTFLAY